MTDRPKLDSITSWIDKHAAERPDCRACDEMGLVCEDHPNIPWTDDVGTTHCGAPGMPCLLIRGEHPGAK